eukprot:284815596_2
MRIATDNLGYLDSCKIRENERSSVCIASRRNRCCVIQLRFCTVVLGSQFRVYVFVRRPRLFFSECIALLAEPFSSSSLCQMRIKLGTLMHCAFWENQSYTAESCLLPHITTVSLFLYSGGLRTKKNAKLVFGSCKPTKLCRSHWRRSSKALKSSTANRRRKIIPSDLHPSLAERPYRCCNATSVIVQRGPGSESAFIFRVGDFLQLLYRTTNAPRIHRDCPNFHWRAFRFGVSRCDLPSLLLSQVITLLGA